jgi:hypothetical protein
MEQYFTEFVCRLACKSYQQVFFIFSRTCNTKTLDPDKTPWLTLIAPAGETNTVSTVYWLGFPNW